MKRFYSVMLVVMLLGSAACGVIFKANSSTDVSVYFYVTDPNGDPNLAIGITDLDIYYIEQGAAMAAKVDMTALAAADTAHTDNKGYDCGQGIMRVDFPDAAFDGGVGKTVELIVRDVTGATDDGALDKIFPITVQLNTDALVKADVQSAVRLELEKAIDDDPNAASISAYVKSFGLKLPSKDYLTATDNSDGDIEAGDMTGYAPANVTQFGGVANADAMISAVYGGSTFEDSADVKAAMETASIATVTGNVEGSVALVTTCTNLTNAPTNGDLTTTMKASVTAAVPAVGAIRTEMETDGSKLDHLWEMTENDGGVRRMTENALEEAPIYALTQDDIDAIAAAIQASIEATSGLMYRIYRAIGTLGDGR